MSRTVVTPPRMQLRRFSLTWLMTVVSLESLIASRGLIKGLVL